jgi:hypothetical protein
VFWHLGEFGVGEESRLLLTTSTERYTDPEKFLMEHHPWDNPEMIGTPITHGAERCLQRISDSASAQVRPHLDGSLRGGLRPFACPGTGIWLSATVFR